MDLKGQLKIAVVGAHGVGKTTFIKEFLLRYPNINFELISGIPRAIIKRGFPMGKNSTIDSYTNYIRDQFRAERKSTNSNKSLIVSDRTVLDASAYALVNSQIPRPYIPSYFIEMLYEVWLREKSFYDIILYIPIEFPMKEDGIRDSDEDYRIKVSTTIERLLIKDNIDYITVNGSIEDRVEKFIRLLEYQYPKILKENYIENPKPMQIESNKTDTGNLKFQLEEVERAGFKEIISLPIIQKMSGVSFLGLLDNVYKVKKPSNRFEHTISVAFLTLKLARKLGLNETDITVLTTAALLHDVGHAPFSHNSEPFLLETKRLYHTGILSKLLIPSSSLQGEKTLEDELLSMYNPSVVEKVTDLLNGTTNNYLSSIFHSPLNCDKIEGNFRSGSYLNLPGVDPLSVIDLFTFKNTTIFVNYASLPLVDTFWNHERNLYWRQIYTPEVFSAEAMLTRALHLTFSTISNGFLYLSDEEVKFQINEGEIGGELINRIENSNYLMPLSSIDNKFLESIQEEFKEFRFDQAKRNELEQKIAKRFHVNKDLVISHFSRRKHFKGNTESLRQLNLFGSLEEDIPLNKINEVLKRTKVSGDFFDVFLPL